MGSLSALYLRCNPGPRASAAHTPFTQPPETCNVKLTAELSLYPFDENYIGIIRAFIEELAADSSVTVVTNAMSTQLCGEWEAVMALVSRCLRESYERHGRQVLVCKFIPGELAIR
jgi:uncharacterized protein YqgV (UPF0045/DUF77 family)